MLIISNPLSAGRVQTYHFRDFTSEQENCWRRDRQVHSEWCGALAQKWSLHGAVRAEHFALLSQGLHPETSRQLVRHQPAKTYQNQYGKEVTSVEHRAGWDATFSAPKSVSLTALVGGDFRVRQAHRVSVRTALEELEPYTQAHIGKHVRETTGKFIAATFEHDTARPVDGYAAPQLHTHAVVFNITERDNRETRALEVRSLFQSQRYATSVYRSELAVRLQNLGYEIETGKHGQPEIRGYTQEYVDASSPRHQQIRKHLQEIGRDSAGAAHVAALQTRDKKEIRSQEVVLQRHRDLSAQFGHQADRVVAQAREQIHQHQQQPETAAQLAATYAQSYVFERSAVQDERAILQSMLERGIGQLRYGDARREFAHRVVAGEFCSLGHKGGHAAPQYTTAEMVRMETEIIRYLQAGNERNYSHPMLISPPLRIRIEDRHPELSASQYHAVDEIFLSREKVVGLDGLAGAGKTRTLAVIREGAVSESKDLRPRRALRRSWLRPELRHLHCNAISPGTNRRTPAKRGYTCSRNPPLPQHGRCTSSSSDCIRKIEF